MKRILFALALLAPLTLVGSARADSQPPAPFPAPVVHGVFVSAQTVTATGQVSDFFAPGDTVVFQAYAIDTKAHKLLTQKYSKKEFKKLSPAAKKAARTSLRRFAVRVPLDDGLSLAFVPESKGVNGLYRWTATWKVPFLYPKGVVHFQVFARTWAGRRGSFAQLPIAASQLTISATPQQPFGPGPQITGTYGANFDVGLFIDAVNGSHPANAPARPVGCTQTNVFKVGEQVVMRAYGYALADGTVLSMDNVTDAHFSVPGVTPDPLLNWGGHGSTNAKSWYWTGFWNIPLNYPIGDVNVHVSFTLVGGKTGTFDYPITIIPQST